MSPYKIDKLRSVADSGLLINVLQMSFDRRSGDAQFIGSLIDRLAKHNCAYHITFSVRKNAAAMRSVGRSTLCRFCDKCDDYNDDTGQQQTAAQN